MKAITKERLDKYFNLTERALKKVVLPKGLNAKERKTAETYLDMAQRYLSDAKHFRKSGNWVNAFAAVNYAHAWLDAGAIIGLFDVGKDNKLFMTDV
tara:strand:+ start:1443 stop:1733 length:291 start_codon:yes stop_codon:yes gene_type:complete